jgi:phage shock protein PspC (stress-responsive transcriptional regulator)
MVPWVPLREDRAVAGSGEGIPEATDTSPRSTRLVRRADRRVVAGVAGGVADALGVNPLWVRLAFLVLTLGAGAGVLLYLALWWLLPREDMEGSGSEEFLRTFPQAPAWAGRIVLIVGVGVLASQIAPSPDQPHWSPPLVAGFVLVALGVALFRRDLANERDESEGANGIAVQGVIAPEPPPRVASPRPIVTRAPHRVRQPRERSRLGVLTVGSAMIAVSVAVLLDGLGSITLDVGRFPALALVFLGAGLLMSAWWGRARGAIVLGVLTLPVALVLSLVHFPFGGDIASRTLSPRRIDPFPTSQRLLAGELFVDLTRVDMAGTSQTLEIEVGAGSVHMIVPRDVAVHLVADVGLGALTVTGQPDRLGVDVTRDLTLPGKPGRGVLVLRVDQGIGSLDLYRPPRKDRSE